MAKQKLNSRNPAAGKSPNQMEAAARMFAALSEPSRLRILQALERGPANVGELCTSLDMKQANVSKQLAILHQNGLLDRARVGNQIRYSIRMQLVFKICDLVCSELHKDAVRNAQQLSPARLP